MHTFEKYRLFTNGVDETATLWPSPCWNNCKIFVRGDIGLKVSCRKDTQIFLEFPLLDPPSWKRVLCNWHHLCLCLCVRLSICPSKFCNFPSSDLYKILQDISGQRNNDTARILKKNLIPWIECQKSFFLHFPHNLSLKVSNFLPDGRRQ